MTGDGPVVDPRHEDPESVLEPTADHKAKVIVGTEVKGNLQRQQVDILVQHVLSKKLNASCMPGSWVTLAAGMSSRILVFTF